MKTPLFWLMVVFIGGFALHCSAARRHRAFAVEAGATFLPQAERCLMPPRTHKCLSGNAVDAASVEQLEIDEVEIERKRFRVTVAAASVILGGLFLFVLLISLVRMSRARRRLLRLGQKNAPTEFIDAWSNYRLDEDGDEQVPSDD